MTFQFSTCRRTRNASKARFSVSKSGIEHSFASADAIDEHFERRYYSPSTLPRGPQALFDTLPHYYTPQTSSVLSNDSSPVSSQASVSSNTYSTCFLDTSETSHEYAVQEVKLEILVQLVDCSLRRMLSDYKLARPGGVVLSSDAGSPKLAAISPALFSLGYVKVQPIIEHHDTTDSLIPGDFAAYGATIHVSTHSVSRASPHKLQRR